MRLMPIILLVITTENLLYNVTKQAISASINISLDSTCKLNKQGFPTIVAGTKELRKKFNLSNNHNYY